MVRRVPIQPGQLWLLFSDLVHLSRQLASTTSRHHHRLYSCLFLSTASFLDSLTVSQDLMATEAEIRTKFRCRCTQLHRHQQLPLQQLLCTCKAWQLLQLQTATVMGFRCFPRLPTLITSIWQEDLFTNLELLDYSWHRCCPTRPRLKHSCKLRQLFTRPMPQQLPTTMRQQ